MTKDSEQSSAEPRANSSPKAVNKYFSKKLFWTRELLFFHLKEYGNLSGYFVDVWKPVHQMQVLAEIFNSDRRKFYEVMRSLIDLRRTDVLKIEIAEGLVTAFFKEKFSDGYCEWHFRLDADRLVFLGLDSGLGFQPGHKHISEIIRERVWQGDESLLRDIKEVRRLISEAELVSKSDLQKIDPTRKEILYRDVAMFLDNPNDQDFGSDGAVDLIKLLNELAVSPDQLLSNIKEYSWATFPGFVTRSESVRHTLFSLMAISNLARKTLIIQILVNPSKLMVAARKKELEQFEIIRASDGRQSLGSMQNTSSAARGYVARSWKNRWRD
jgi:hypothetical protein